MKYFMSLVLMLLFPQVTIADNTAIKSMAYAGFRTADLRLQIEELKKNLAELQKEVEELKLVKVTCICEVNTGSFRAGGLITGEGINATEAEDNATESCRSQNQSTAVSVFNCLDKRLDNVRHYIFQGDSREPSRPSVKIGPSG